MTSFLAIAPKFGAQKEPLDKINSSVFLYAFIDKLMAGHLECSRTVAKVGEKYFQPEHPEMVRGYVKS